jgi:hypothetical protein
MKGEVEARAEGKVRERPPVAEKDRAITGQKGRFAPGEGAVAQKVQADGKLLGLIRLIGLQRQGNENGEKNEEG